MSSRQSTLRIGGKRQPNLNDLVRKNQELEEKKALQPTIIVEKCPSEELRKKESRQQAIKDFLKTPEELKLEREKRKLEKQQQEVRDHFFLKDVKPTFRMGFRSVE